MTTRWTSFKKTGGFGFMVCGIILIGFAAHAQLDSDSDLTGEGANEPPPASAPAETRSAPAASAAQATTQAPATNSQAATSARKSSGNGKRTSIDFEDELIEGQTQKPELFYLLQKRQFNYKRMIRLRDNFLPEMRKTAEEIQRKGSGD